MIGTPALAADLVRSKVGVIVAWSGQATKAAQEATRTIPIVMSLVNDPVGSGLVASLARPGGNVTGTTVVAPDVVGKRLELLKEVVPKVSRVAVLQHPDNPASAPLLREVEDRAGALRVRLQILGVRNPAEIARVRSCYVSGLGMFAPSSLTVYDFSQSILIFSRPRL